jgi:hypothetical protein
MTLVAVTVMKVIVVLAAQEVVGGRKHTTRGLANYLQQHCRMARGMCSEFHNACIATPLTGADKGCTH